jgi:putative transcriptional regulator
MSIHHHPDDSTLLSYAAGSLSDAFEILVRCHLHNCSGCRQRISEAELLAGSLLADIKPTPVSSRDQFLSRLEHEGNNIHPLETQINNGSTAFRAPLPSALQRFLDKSDNQLEWKSLVPGVKQIKLETSTDNLKLLKISPGICIPDHSHKGSELTLVLQGNYSDALGSFHPGDVADLSPEHHHQPVTGEEHACICLVATDAPLKFHGVLPRLVQPFIDF